MKFFIHRWTGFILCFAAVPLLGQSPTEEDPDEKQLMSDPNPKFSFLDPDSYHLADESQRSLLKDIYHEEFSLDHLSVTDQQLLTEALSKSGVEVQSTCKVHKETTANVKAFFRSYDETSKIFFFPANAGQRASYQIYESLGSPHIIQDLEYQPITEDAADYPYPLSEAIAVIKPIPINLSSIAETSRADSTVTFEAYPSKLLYAKLSKEDLLWNLDDATVTFEVDLNRKRMNWLNLQLKKPVSPHILVRIAGFQLKYEFEDHEVLKRNVVKSVDHYMIGRLALVFRPNLHTTNVFTYESCVAPPPTESYLFRSMEAIAKH